MELISENNEWNRSRSDLITVLERFGTHGKSSDADFWLADENMGGAMHGLYVFNIDRLTCALLTAVMQFLREKYAIWDVMFLMDFTGTDGTQVPPEGIVVRGDSIDELWDRDRLAALCGQQIKLSDCAHLFLSHEQDAKDVDPARQDAHLSHDGITRCYDALKDVGNRVGCLDDPCRTTIIAATAWGIIENGGFDYFFGNDFDDDPDYDVFTQAFYRIGLTEIGARFSGLVKMFPFSDPHLSVEQRRAYMESEPSDFIAAKDELENLIYTHDDIDQILNAFIEKAKQD